MKNKKYQGGLSTIGWLAAVTIILFIATCLIKIGPIYLENLTVKQILTQVSEEASSAGLNKNEVRDRIGKRFTINTVKGIGIKEVLITTKGNQITIDGNYEVQRHLFFNIDVVVIFDDLVMTIELPAR